MQIFCKLFADQKFIKNLTPQKPSQNLKNRTLGRPNVDFEVQKALAGRFRPGNWIVFETASIDPRPVGRMRCFVGWAGFSERHLTRVFIREVGVTPARYVEAVRVEAARGLLERSDAPLATVARQAGLGSAESLRRAFARTMGTKPETACALLRAPLFHLALVVLVWCAAWVVGCRLHRRHRCPRQAATVGF